MSNNVTFTPGYFPDATIGRPVSNGKIYVGIIDLDPEIEANQKQVSVLQESGVIVEVDQPITTSGGGVPQYTGSPVTILVDGAYSLKVLNKNDEQEYYVPNSGAQTVDEKAFPVDTIPDLRATFGAFQGQAAIPLGYDEAGDGGGGPKRIWFTGEAVGFYVDNDSSIIVPGDGSAAWLWEYSGNINAKWAGGTTTSIIESVIDISDTASTIQIPGEPEYDDAVLWNGRKHDTQGAPFLLNSFTWSGAGLNARMVVKDGFLYCTEFTASKVAVFSLADPRNPTYIASFSTGLNPRHIDIVGRYAFVCCGGANSVEVHDISNPAQIVGTLVGTISVGASPKMFRIVGNEIYVVCYGASTIEKYSYFLPYSGLTGFSSSLLVSTAVSTGPLSVDYNGSGLLAVSGLDSNLIDILASATLALIGSTPIGGVAHSTCVWVNRTQLLTTDATNNRLYSLDCQTLTPVVSSFVDTSENPEQIQIVGHRCYIPSLTADGVPAFLDCFDLTDAESPVRYKSVELSVTGAGFTAFQDDGETGYLYVNGHFAPYNIDVIETEPFELPLTENMSEERRSIQNLGVSNLDVRKATVGVSGSSGATSDPLANLIAESGTDTYVNMLMPATAQGGMSWGRPGTPSAASLIYSHNVQAFYLAMEGLLSKIILTPVSPEGQVASAVGGICINVNGSLGSVLFIKEAGIGVNGWAAK